jgi:aryl-alcohol dehydrogenase-like predicted oxidoreductase
MDYVRFGRTGLEVSRICLGCMSYGVPERGSHPWTLDEESSRPFIKKALEAGINFFDTANVYSDGTSEDILGRALKDFARRDEVVIATKLHGRMRPGPNGAGLSRRAILGEIDNSQSALEPTMSTSTKSTAGTITLRSKRHLRPSTMSSGPGRRATSARLRCTRGSSQGR